MPGHQIAATCKFTKRKRRKVRIKDNLGKPLVLTYQKPGHDAREANFPLYPQYQECATLGLKPCTVWGVSVAKKLPATQLMETCWKIIPLDVSFGNKMYLVFFETKQGR